MAERDAWEQPLYRFAFLLLRDEETARKIVLETLEAGISKRPAHIDPERLVMLQFRDVRKKALKIQEASSAVRMERGNLPPAADEVLKGVDSEKAANALRALPEPGRSALALLLFDALEAEWIAKMLGLAPADFSGVVQGARLALHESLAEKPEAAPR